MEFVGLGVMGIGGLLAFIGWIWLIIIGFKTDGPLWGILNIIFQPITGLIFCITHKTGWLQFAMMVIGFILSGVGFIPVAMTSHIF